MSAVNVYFDRHDVWVGAYWRYSEYVLSRELFVYICLLPMLVIRIRFPERERKREEVTPKT